MKRLIRRTPEGAELRRRLFSEKWAVALLGILLLLGCVVVYGLLRYAIQSTEKELRDAMHQSVVQRKNNVDYRLRALRLNAEGLMGVVYPYMNSEAGDKKSQMAEFTEVNSIISIYENSDTVTRVRIYVPDSKFYSSQRHTFYPISDLGNSETGKQAPYLADSGLFWQEQGTINAFVDNELKPVQVISCVYSIRERANYDRIACVLFMNMDVKLLEGALTVAADSNAQVWLVNSEGMSLTPFGGLEIGERAVAENIMARISEQKAGDFKLDGMQYVFEKLDETDWYVVMSNSLGSIYRRGGAAGGTFFLLVFGVIAAFIALCAMVIYAITMSTALRRMNTALREFYPEAEGVAGSQEKMLDVAYQMEKSVDQMVRTVNELTEKRYRDQIAIAEYEMKALQEQIKPHFLYNTLDIIKWMIMDGRSEDGIWMVNALSRYLRQSINRGPGIITIKEELELSKTYLMIMMKRFPNRFSVEYEVEEETGEYCIPKFSLQPLLENALLHGILYCDKEEKKLIIRAWKEERLIWIEVEDNGNGMSEEKLSELQAGGGYGLSNVRKRLTIFGKGEGAFNISSKKEIGTCISIRIPAVTSPEPGNMA